MEHDEPRIRRFCRRNGGSAVFDPVPRKRRFNFASGNLQSLKDLFIGRKMFGLSKLLNFIIRQ
jgi:hypothetical protein